MVVNNLPYLAMGATITLRFREMEAVQGIRHLTSLMQL